VLEDFLVSGKTFIKETSPMRIGHLTLAAALAAVSLTSFAFAQDAPAGGTPGFVPGGAMVTPGETTSSMSPNAPSRASPSGSMSPTDPSNAALSPLTPPTDAMSADGEPGARTAQPGMRRSTGSRNDNGAMGSGSMSSTPTTPDTSTTPPNRR
jgi:hypothetical protein